MTRTTQTRRRIMEAAAALFAARGYTGATTRLIAAEAGVSELTLFRHFGNKKNLFLAVLEEKAPAVELQTLLSVQITGEIHHDLRLIGGAFLRALSERQDVILLTLREAEQIPELRQAASFAPVHQRRLLAGYLEHQMNSGVLRPQDPLLAAQAFLGMFFAFVLSQQLSGESALPASLEQVTQAFVDIFLQGALRQE